MVSVCCVRKSARIRNDAREDFVALDLGRIHFSNAPSSSSSTSSHSSSTSSSSLVAIDVVRELSAPPTRFVVHDTPERFSRCRPLHFVYFCSGSVTDRLYLTSVCDSFSRTFKQLVDSRSLARLPHTYLVGGRRPPFCLTFLIFRIHTHATQHQFFTKSATR